MTYHKSKKEITEAILSELPQCNWHDMPLDTVVFRWWVTGRGGFGLRLSDEGVSAFAEANIEYYEFPLGASKKPFSPEAFIQELSKKIACPYYIGVNNNKKTAPVIKLYDNKIAMMMTLYGTLREYLDSVK